MEMGTNADTFRERLAGLGEREALLVVTDPEVVGWGIVKQYSDRLGYRVTGETSIYLDRGLRGRGYGSNLQQALMERCAAFGYHHIVARIWATNQGSIAFHQKFGYQLVGIQKEVGFLAGQWRDVAIMQCLLSEVGPYRPELG